MKLIRCLAILVLALSAASASAQGTDIIVWGSWADLGSQDFEDAELEFEADVGFGIGANWFWGDRFSTELSVMTFDVETEITFDLGVPEEPLSADLGSFEMTPIMLTGQFHFAADGRFDPYVGLGAAYVLSDEISSDNVRDIFEIDEIEIDDEFTFLVNAGVGIAFTPNFGLNIDARYVPFEPKATSVDDPEGIDLELNPLILSLGLRWRF